LKFIWFKNVDSIITPINPRAKTTAIMAIAMAIMENDVIRLDLDRFFLAKLHRNFIFFSLLIDDRLLLLDLCEQPKMRVLYWITEQL